MYSAVLFLSFFVFALCERENEEQKKWLSTLLAQATTSLQL
jgi:hypothetical protein